MNCSGQDKKMGVDFVIHAGREKWKQLPSHSHECSWIEGTQRWQSHLFFLRGNVSRKGLPLLSFSKQFLLLTIRSLEGHTPTFISLLANDLNQSVLPFSHNAVENQLFSKKLQRHSDSSAPPKTDIYLSQIAPRSLPNLCSWQRGYDVNTQDCAVAATTIAGAQVKGTVAAS